MKTVPRVLLVGAGCFGQNHLRVLKDLAYQSRVELVGVVVRDAAHRRHITKEYDVTTYPRLTKKLLKNVDAVDIVTPPETHFDLVKKCLQYADVFVEKPLAMNAADAHRLEKMARRYKRTLTVGHIFRFHPVSLKLKALLPRKGIPSKINGSFVNPVSSDQDREPSLELLHLFDVIDFLWSKRHTMVSARSEGRVSVVHVRYGKNTDAHFVLGWRGNTKERTLIFKYPQLTVQADFLADTVTVSRKSVSKKYKCPPVEEPLRKELVSFLKAVAGVGKNEASAVMAARIVSIAEQAIPKSKHVPRIAVIGGGIFGTSVAAELSVFGDVSIFEKNAELLQEGSYVNCYRHHHGYHYPRSDETVVDVQCSRIPFEKIFKDALLHTPTYYALAKEGSYVSVKEFLAFCKKHNLPYKKSFPQGHLLAKKEINLSIRVPEPSYDYGKLKEITTKRLDAMPNIDIRYNTLVTGITFDTKGAKAITYRSTDPASSRHREKRQKFDIVVNATYANINRFARWLDFETYPIRVDLAEVVVIKLPIPPISITVIDGPFATLMPIDKPGEFVLYHVKESILDRYVPANGLVKKFPKGYSNQEAILAESAKFFPILKKATIVESRIVHRGVLAYHEHDDARVADLIEHGFGCWSILSGKILSSVMTAKRLSRIIRNLPPQTDI